jgi:hypothetical protein
MRFTSASSTSTKDTACAASPGAAGRTLVLIRPDGYVALISDAGDVSAVSGCLAAVR